MFRGLYTAGWGMLTNGRSMEVVSNNLANVNTTGFKKDVVVFESFPDMLTKRINDTQSNSNPTNKVGDMAMGVKIGEVFVNYRQGNLQKTSSKLDVAISGEDKAFFTIGVKDKNGNINEYYTRDGSFKVNNEGKLITSDGFTVIGENGEIQVNNDELRITDDGTIYNGDERIDKLKVVQFEDTRAMKKFGYNLISKDTNQEPQQFTGTIIQEYLETSNVNVVREMVDMITISRNYETNQKVVQTIDEAISKTVNEVGVVR